MSTVAKKPETVFRLVQRTAEKILNADPATIAVMDAGDVVRQGDLYIVRIDQSIDGEPYGSRQLAPGTTQGSRHVVTGDCRILKISEETASSILRKLVPATRGHQQLIGPEIIATEPVTIEHPEHGHRTIPAGSYLVVYQRTWANEVRRVAD